MHALVQVNSLQARLSAVIWMLRLIPQTWHRYLQLLYSQVLPFLSLHRRHGLQRFTELNFGNFREHGSLQLLILIVST
jgi:hypothetical protein